MDTDELLVLAFGLIVAFKVGVPWYRHLLHFGLPRTRAVVWQRSFLGAVPIALVAALALILARDAAREVREDSAYILLFLALGATWLVETARASVQIALRPTRAQPQRDLLKAGVFPALGYVSFGVLDLLWLGRAP